MQWRAGGGSGGTAAAMVEVAAVALATAEGTAVWLVPGHQSAAHATRAPMNFPADRVRVFSPQASPPAHSNCTPTKGRVPVRYVRPDVPFCSLRRNNDNSPSPRPSSRGDPHRDPT